MTNGVRHDCLNVKGCVCGRFVSLYIDYEPCVAGQASRPRMFFATLIV
jgi:hypothetical protein